MNIFHYIFNNIKTDKGNKIIISNSTKLRNCNIKIRGKNNVVEFKANTILKSVQVEVRGNNCHLVIGNDTIIGENTYLSVRENGIKLIIGSNCMFSRNVKIMTSDGHDILLNGKKINNAKDIIIGNNVWITDNVTVLKGVEVEDGAVLAINATVTKNVPKNAIVAGNPAKVIKENIEWREELTF